MPSRDNGSARSTDEEEFLLLVSGLPRRWQWQELKDLVRRSAPRVKQAYTCEKERCSEGVGVITIFNEAKARKAYDELSRRTVEGHHLSLALKNPSGEVIAGAITKAMYEASHTSPHTPHTLRAPVTSPLLMSPLPVTSPAYSFYGNHQSAGRTMNGTTLPHMKGEDYEGREYRLEPTWVRGVERNTTYQSQHEQEPFAMQLPSTIPSTIQSHVPSMSPLGYVTYSPMTAIPAPINPTVSSQGIYNPYVTGNQPYTYAASAPQTIQSLQNPAMTPMTSFSEPAPLPTQKTVYIQNVPHQATWQDLKDHLKRSGGHVDHCKFHVEQDGHSKGRAFATFRTAGEAQRAVRDLDGKKFWGKKLNIRFNEKEKKVEVSNVAAAERSPPPAPVGRTASRTGPVIVDGTPLAVRRRRT